MITFAGLPMYWSEAALLLIVWGVAGFLAGAASVVFTFAVVRRIRERSERDQ